MVLCHSIPQRVARDFEQPAGFLITFRDGKRVYDAADTGLFGDMRLIGEEGLDLAILPIGDNYTMGPDDALRAVKFLQPKKVLPIHYDTFPLIEQNPHDFVQKVESRGLRAKALAIGESCEI